MSLQTPYTNDQMLRLLSLAHKSSQKNLLDNWYFAEPINQRGQTEYADTAGYFIDRWTRTSSAGGVITLVDGGIKIDNTNGAYTMYVRQKFDAYPIDTYTMSVFAADVTGKPTVYIGKNDDVFTTAKAVSNGITKHTVTPDKPITRLQLTIPIGASITLKAAKLELGTEQTLAHQDDTGTWVLNDPPPNKQQELAKCQRYQIRIGYKEGSTYAGAIGFGYMPSSGTKIRVFVPTPVSMLKNPTLIFFNEKTESENLYVVSAGISQTVNSVTTVAQQNGILFICDVNEVTPNEPCILRLNSYNGMLLDANL